MSAARSLWHWLPQALLYPLRGNALGFLLVFAPVLWLATLAGLWGLWALVIFGAWSINYVFTCTARTALGEAHPPALDAAQLNPFDRRMGTTLIYTVTWGLLPPVAAILLPAHLVLVSLRHHRASLGPRRLTQTLHVMGYNGVLAGALSLAIPLGLVFIEHLVPRILLLAGALYWLVFSAHIAGFGARHARHELGLATLYELEHDDITRRRHMDRLMETVLALDRTGKRGEALKTLMTPTNAVGWPDHHSYQIAVLHRLLDNDRERLACAWTRHVLADLLRHRRRARVVEVLALTRGLEPRRLPEAARTRLTLARIARDAGRTDLALAVLAEHDGRNPDMDAGHAALLHARLLAEQGDDRTAGTILRRLRNHGHAPLMAGVKELEAILGKLSC